MPQMSPMSWTLVFILCMASMMISMIVVHYNSRLSSANSHSDAISLSNKVTLKFNI